MKLWLIVAGTLLGCVFWGPQGAHADLKTLRREAHKGIPQAEFKLGELYQYGTGQADHLVHALAWYERAAPKVPRAAVLAKRTAAKLTPEQRQQAAALAELRLGPP